MRIVGSTGYLEVTTIPTSILAGVVSYYTRRAAAISPFGFRRNEARRQFWGALESKIHYQPATTEPCVCEACSLIIVLRVFSANLGSSFGWEIEIQKEQQKSGKPISNFDPIDGDLPGLVHSKTRRIWQWGAPPFLTKNSHPNPICS